ncbi:carbohydrate porin [Acidihalobacter prosperus]
MRVNSSLQYIGYTLLGLFFAFTGQLGFIPALADPIFKPHLQWNVESVSNLSGGLKPGSSYDSLMYFSTGARTHKLGLWRGGKVNITLADIASGQPSQNLIGDFQGASNIAAPNAARIYDAWYNQKIGASNDIKAGIVDLNSIFDVTKPAGTLLNSSFGLDPSLSGNFQVSTYPEPGYGFVLEHHQNSVNLLTGWFQGNPSKRNRLGSGGNVYIGEADIGNSSNTPTRIDIGIWRYLPDPNNSTISGRTGGYINFTQIINRGPVDQTTCFLRIGGTASKNTPVPYSFDLGADISAPVPSRPNDQLSVGITQAALHNLKAETAYEATYVAAITSTFSIQPDLQYISHLSGGDGHATVFMMRFELSMI